MSATLATTQSCRAPTQMTLHVGTLGTLRCPELRRVMIVTGPTPADVEQRAASKFFAADTRECQDDTTVGSLVITPDGDHGAVLVMASFDAEKTCEPPMYAGCIVARRFFSFQDHVREEMPISFEIDCRDVPCEKLTSCRHGNCASAEVTCNDDGLCESPAEPTSPTSPDASVDGPPTTVDGSTDGPRDAPADVGIDATKDSGNDGSTAGPATNFCPPDKRDKECIMGDVCCIQQDGTADCEHDGCSGGMIAAALICTGTKYCTNPTMQYCCLQSGSTPTSSCVGSGCSYIICEHDADCAGIMGAKCRLGARAVATSSTGHCEIP